MSRRSALTGYRRVLRHPDFRRLAAALTISSLGDWIYIVALVAYVYARTHSALWLAGLTLARQLPILLLAPIGGAIADRVSRRGLLVSCDLAQALVMLGLAISAGVHASVVVLVALAVLAKVFEAPYQPAVAAETPHLVSERELAVANSLIGTISNAAVVAGPLLGALSVLLGSVEVAFVVNAATFFVAAGLVSVTRGMSRGRLDVERRPLAVLAETWDGLRAVVSSPAARAILAIVAGASFIYGADTVLLVLTSTRQLGSGSHAYGYFIGALGVGGLVAVPVVDWFAGMRRVGTALYVGTLLVAVPIVLLRWTHALPPALLLVGVSGAALMLVEVTTITALQRAVPEQLLARVFGAYDSCYVFGMIVGALLSDPLVHAIGLGWTFVVFGLGQPAVMLAAVPGLVAVNRASAARLAALRDRIALFAGLDLFAGAPRAVAEELAGAAVEFDVPTGTEVVREGEPAHDFFVVRSGRLDVVSAGESGEPRWVNELSAGSYFGEIGLLLGRPRTATVRASADSELYRLSAEEFLAAVNGSAAAGRVAVEGVGQRLARTHPRLASSAPFTMPAGEGLAV